MNINFDKNREMMIENQLRPNKIKNIVILDIFNKVSKERFISEDKINICYSDQDISVKDSRGYLKNLHLAQILNFSINCLFQWEKVVQSFLLPFSKIQEQNGYNDQDSNLHLHPQSNVNLVHCL